MIRVLYILTLSSITIILYSCKENKKVTHYEASTKDSVEPIDRIEGLPAGDSYSDSLINIMVGQQIQKSETNKIDTLRVLHSFEKSKFFHKPQDKFDLELVKQYETLDNPITKAQHQLLNITDYLFDLSFSENFKTYVFYNKSKESHFGNAIELRTIPDHFNNVGRLTLAQFYGNENYEKNISSTLVSKDTIVRHITAFFGPRNNNGFMDEGSRQESTKEVYHITESGEIDLIKTNINQ